LGLWGLTPKSPDPKVPLRIEGQSQSLARVGVSDEWH